ncbi:MAG: DUF4224 domain-containing protein [Methylobacillus sp.]|jgi:hypothetical protein|nr:DUF4224 domain-containing protein [Methylobacillus sp.]
MMDAMDAFLTSKDIAELTGIKRGHNGKTREQLQLAQLRSMGVACRTNVRGVPVVTWTAVNGISQTSQQIQHIPAALRRMK